MSWICHKGIEKGVRKKLWRLLWCATIYFIWQECNHRLHGGQVREPMIIFQLTRLCIRALLLLGPKMFMILFSVLLFSACSQAMGFYILLSLLFSLV